MRVYVGGIYSILFERRAACLPVRLLGELCTVLWVQMHVVVFVRLVTVLRVQYDLAAVGGCARKDGCEGGKGKEGL